MSFCLAVLLRSIQEHPAKSCSWVKANEVACTQAVGWSKKPEFVMRSPSWIRAARSGPG